MCDYSLHHVASRPAKVGDRLKTTKFANAVTAGFAAIAESDVAVCMRPGTELAFDQDVVYFKYLGFIPASIPYRVARFCQIDIDRPNTHHDALEFPNGQIVLVTRLCKGLDATVLQLPADRESGSAEMLPQQQSVGLTA